MDDAERMRQAIEVAADVRASTSPNPWVGCVIESPSGEVFVGATEPPGGRHAEVVALDAAGDAARGGSAWVTLEPCAHIGRTGPCAEALIDAGLARVVIALEDPDSRVAGAGIERLRAAGVEVEVGVLADVVRTQLAAYLKHRTTGRPWVVLKAGSSLDGRTAAPDGSSQWITGGAARADSHQLRAESDAIVVGAGTVRADDPSLTVRNVEGKDPIRVVLGTAPAGARVLPALEFTGELTDLLDALGQRGVLQVLVEGGATVAGAFHRAGLVDHYVIYLAPVLFGGDDARPLFAGAGAETIADVWRGAITNVTPLGGDVRIDLSPVGPSPVTGPVPVVRIGSVPPVSNPASGGA
ncbi:bifunctional diaminohydroxyphosphoribosylaminopyrimidine deaminase/5-amino-6-(5-phosphoribosylamino)uracil reductase RibD [Aquihabitans daechungensis]|uniref:bifunctional diaminohydroxyphosphoribosylaminopyrimidine deaminase/5-amino-6-(5-phosphoribosylamino)uracil reductase RibD n=1 Tax=Aquihabitans daechungensis TaxID=1052257 RepID=UPI003BA00EBE